MNPGVRFSQLTHVGMRRANNQDSLAVMIAESEERFHQRGHLFVVADGMGAHAAGELASKIASERIATNYYCGNQKSVQMAVLQAVQDANASIHDRGRSNPEFHNMGTTASTLVLVEGQAHVAHVGDSRVYRWRDGVLEQLTFDHSLVWEMHASGQVRADSPFSQKIPKNVITRSLGPSEDVTVDLEGPFEIRLHDRFLLCSDGLTGQVTDEELGTILGCVDIDKAVKLLVDLANLRGGPDNTTVIVVDVNDQRMLPVGGGQAAPPAERRGTVGTPSNALLGTMAFCWLGAIGFGIAAAFFDRKYIGSAVVAFILGSIAAGVWASGLLQSPRSGVRRRSGAKGGLAGTAAPNELSETTSAMPRPAVSMAPHGDHAFGTGPYRRFNVTPGHEIYQRLRQLVDELHDTSERKRWMLDWTTVMELSTAAKLAAEQRDFRRAIELQGDAVLASMEQLRRQQDESASETAVDL